MNYFDVSAFISAEVMNIYRAALFLSEDPTGYHSVLKLLGNICSLNLESRLSVTQVSNLKRYSNICTGIVENNEQFWPIAIWNKNFHRVSHFSNNVARILPINVTDTGSLLIYKPVFLLAYDRKTRSCLSETSYLHFHSLKITFQ